MDRPVFRAIRHASLAAAGLGREGVDVMLEDGALILLGAAGARRTLPLAEIGRARFGYEQNRYSGKLYRMQVWSEDAARPLILATVHADEPAFASIARALAASLWARGPGAVEGGLNWPAALIPALWMLAAFPAAVFLPSLQARSGGHQDPLWLVTLVVGAFIVPLIGIMLWFFYRLIVRTAWPDRRRSTAICRARKDAADAPVAHVALIVWTFRRRGGSCIAG